MSSLPPTYLQPYLNATKKYGAGFGSLLWASPKTQAVRFSALLRAVNCTGKVVLDAGCGRADLLEFMLGRAVYPMQYLGLEAVETLAEAAEKKRLPNGRIIRGDFVCDPAQLDVDADVIFFCGSLNTLDERAFYQSITRAFSAAKQAVVFNFLCSAQLAASPHLTWHQPEAVLALAGKLSDNVRFWDNYLPGDGTISIRKDSGQS
jgi:SAM-dependent methyltransferase